MTRYSVFGTNAVGTYSHTVSANSEADAIRKARPVLTRMAFWKRGLRFGVSSVECPHCRWGFGPSVIAQHIREKHGADSYDYAADDQAFDAAREDRVFGRGR